MKKMIKKLGFIVILAVIGLTMGACNSEPACSHDWTGWNLISFGRETRNCNSCTAVQARLTRNIGETGEAVGRIFYCNAAGFTLQDINPVNNKTVYYLEAWTANETASEWGDYGILVVNITTFTSNSASAARIIGNGRKDTQIIAAHMTGKSITGTAAQRCASATHGGRNDWFLPSLGELSELKKAKGQPNVPTSGSFWSSSQFGSSAAWGEWFDSDYPINSAKDSDSNDVRAVRAF
ncbi:MAG: DUF1566 domain-containing protein [Treponema sp.]|nr:DUF1566 domain-containing protein [Treponema sp.]